MCPAGKLKEWSLLFYGTAEHPYNTLGAPQPRARPPEASEMEPSRAAFLQSQVEVAEEEEEYAGKSRGVAPKHPQNANWDELGGLGGGGREERCLWPERGSRMAKLEGGGKKKQPVGAPAANRCWRRLGRKNQTQTQKNPLPATLVRTARCIPVSGCPGRDRQRPPSPRGSLSLGPRA